MARRILLACLLVTLCIPSGCIFENVPTPAIVPDCKPPHIIDVEKAEQSRPPIHKQTQLAGIVKENYPPGWVPAKHLERKWTAIVLHHSATDIGNAAFFNKAHEGRCDENGIRWKGIGYDFVIGNGTMSRDGQVEVTFRWLQQITGAHCKTDRTNWANRSAIGICLVGNFDTTTPSQRQMESLLKLVKFLQQRYKIPKSRIYGHKHTPGAGPTACPGEKFPMWQLKSQLDF
jgi:hypothetical protein